MAVELTQELVAIITIASVCAVLSVSCVLLWLVRCRRDQIRHQEEKNDRQRELDNFEENQNKKKGTPFSKRKVHESKSSTKLKKQESQDVEKGKPASAKKAEKKAPNPNEAKEHETMEQFEKRIRMQNGTEAGAATDTPALRNKRLDTVSVLATASTETLQRNDSKVNVFPVERVEEIDLNPGLNSPINLEAI